MFQLSGLYCSGGWLRNTWTPIVCEQWTCGLVLKVLRRCVTLHTVALHTTIAGLVTLHSIGVPYIWPVGGPISRAISSVMSSY